MTENPFVVGAEIAKVNYPRWGGVITITRVKVAKVYKTGKITVEGSPQQYKPNYGGKKWSAQATGTAWRHCATLEPITDELLEKVAESEKRFNREILFSTFSKDWKALCKVATDNEVLMIEGLLARAKSEPTP